MSGMSHCNPLSSLEALGGALPASEIFDWKLLRSAQAQTAYDI